jgi:hypothetical protein
MPNKFDVKLAENFENKLLVTREKIRARDVWTKFCNRARSHLMQTIYQNVFGVSKIEAKIGTRGILVCVSVVSVPKPLFHIRTQLI